MERAEEAEEARAGPAWEGRAPNVGCAVEPPRGELETSMEHNRDVRIIAVPYDSGHPGLRMGVVLIAPRGQIAHLRARISMSASMNQAKVSCSGFGR
jgi:hypothetical protein